MECQYNKIYAFGLQEYICGSVYGFYWSWILKINSSNNNIIKFSYEIVPNYIINGTGKILLEFALTGSVSHLK